MALEWYSECLPLFASRLYLFIGGRRMMLCQLRCGARHSLCALVVFFAAGEWRSADFNGEDCEEALGTLLSACVVLVLSAPCAAHYLLFTLLRFYILLAEGCLLSLSVIPVPCIAAFHVSQTKQAEAKMTSYSVVIM